MPIKGKRTCKRIVIYNHKGGVGKTTLTVNIAFALGLLGKKVLMVDSDPQCNLTSYLIEDSVVDDLLDHSDADEGQTIWSALRPIHEALGDVRLIKPLKQGKNVFLLPGDIRLSEFEDGLTDLWGDCVQRRVRGYRGVTALSSLVSQTIKNNDIDYVFYDAGPNIGPLNKVILLDCDYFIIPAACDLFSVRALKTLGHTLLDWMQTWRRIADDAPDGIYLMPGRPELLGFIPQRFKIYRGQPSRSFTYYLNKIEKNISSEIIATLRKFDSALIQRSLRELKLGQIKDFGSLANEALNQGVPMWLVQGIAPSQKSEVRDEFKNIARKIIAFSSRT